MNALDIALFVIVALSTVLGILRGLVRELIGLVGVLASIAIAYFFAPRAAVGLGLSDSVLTYVLISAALFVAGLIAFAIVGRLVGGLVKALRLSGVDRGLGAFFGFARAIAITVALLVLAVLVVDPQTRLLRTSRVLWVERDAVEWLGTRIPIESVREEFERRWRVVRPRHGRRV